MIQTQSKILVNTYLIVVGLALLISTFQSQLLELEQFRLGLVRSLPEQEGIWGWLQSLLVACLFLFLAVLAYRLHCYLEHKRFIAQVVVDDYERADYKLIPREEYLELRDKPIPQPVKDRVLERDGLRCRYTGVKLNTEPPGKITKYIWDSYKSKSGLIPALVRVLVSRYIHFLNFDHVIPVKFGGENSVENIVACEKVYNIRKSDKLVGRNLEFALFELRRRGKTIHRDCLK